MNEQEAQVLFTAAFVAALAEMPDIPKGKTATIKTKAGGEFSYAYADLPSVISAVRPVLAQHGLVAAQATDTLADGTVSVTTRVYHEAGHVEAFGTLTLPAGEDARGAGSALTYARRYSLCAALGIAADEDTDGAGATAGAKAAAPKEYLGDELMSEQQRKKIEATVAELDRNNTPFPEGSPEDVTTWDGWRAAYMLAKYGRHSRKQYTKAEAHHLIDRLEKAKIPF